MAGARIGKDDEVAADLSELSSIAALLEQLTGRITVMAESAQHAHDDAVATELFSVERALAGAQRRVGRLLVERRT